MPFLIGAGHNGLTCAAYLGMAGLRVRVLERRGVVGGASVTEEFHPASATRLDTVGLLKPQDHPRPEAHEHGLRIVDRRAQNFLPRQDGRYLLVSEGRTEREIAKFSARDAAR
jgi:phytoene dehydrogenase-like protein